MTNPRVALYARVSKEDDPDDPKKQHIQNPENQLMLLRKYAQERGYSVYAHEYVDRQSGKDVDRPEFQQMIRDARGHRFQIILMTDVDRFARSTIHLHTEMKRLNDSNVKVCFINQPMASTDTPEGELLLGFLAVVAQFERRLISRRTKAGLAHAVAQGKRLGRPQSAIPTQRILELHNQGFSLKGIGREVGMTPQGVRKRLNRAGVTKGGSNQT